MIPPYLTMREIAKACRLPTWKVKRRLLATGIAERHGGPRSGWVVGESRLRERLPEMYDRVWEHFAKLERTRTCND